jgi:hypothetical protein
MTPIRLSQRQIGDADRVGGIERLRQRRASGGLLFGLGGTHAPLVIENHEPDAVRDLRNDGIAERGNALL